MLKSRKLIEAGGKSSKKSINWNVGKNYLYKMTKKLQSILNHSQNKALYQGPLLKLIDWFTDYSNDSVRSTLPLGDQLITLWLEIGSSKIKAFMVSMKQLIKDEVVRKGILGCQSGFIGWIYSLAITQYNLTLSNKIKHIPGDIERLC